MAEVVTGALGSLLPKLAQLLTDEYKLQKGVKGDIRFLRDELQMMKTFLDVMADRTADGLDRYQKDWASDLRELSYDIEDIIDRFTLHNLDSSPAEQHGLKKIIDMSSNLLVKPKIRRQIASDIRDIKFRVVELSERRARYKISSEVAKPSSMVDHRLSPLFHEQADLIGIDEATYDLIKMMMMEGNDYESRHQDKIVSIVGIGGLGKTTLANVVYQKLRAQFDCSAFISVSRAPSVDNLFKAMFRQLASNHPAAGANVINEIKEILHNKRYFLVIDDLWETSSWKLIADAFVKNNNGSRIIVTTRNFQVASEVGEVYMMKPLSYINSKRLLYRRIFGSEEDFQGEYGLDEASDVILKKCGGLPLAIITIGSLLATKPKKDWLNSVGFVLGENRGVDNTMSILSLSYYDLPNNLRPCLLYLSIYPEGHFIKKNKLIWRWIAEGFVRSEQTVGLFELGKSYFNELINRSLIQLVEIRGTGIAYGCQVHDLVLQFICSLSREENFVSVLNEGDQIFPSRKFRRLAIQNRKEEQSLAADNRKLVEVRSLYAIGCPIYMIPPVSSFHMLRVLDLESCGSMEGYDIKHLGKLLFLRFIGLRNTFLRTLPKELGHLKFLQTLELEGSGVEDLPASIGELTSLMCLNADWTTRVADWIIKLASLQQLVMYPGVGNDEHSVRWFLTGLRNMKELRELRFLIKAYDEELLRDLLETVLNLPKIEVLHFDYYGAQLSSSIKLEPSGFACRGHLRSLELQLLEFSRLPAWIDAQYFPQLCHLSLTLFDVDEQDLEKLGRFAELSHLHLLIVNTEHRDAITCASGGFQNLRFCSITKPFKFLQGAMLRLEVLEFHFNVRLQTGAERDLDFVEGFIYLPSLRQVIVQINSLDAIPEKVEEAMAALQKAIPVHPNHPILEINLSRRKLEKEDNNEANDISNSHDKGKGVEVAKGGIKSVYYSKSLSLARDGIDEPMDDIIKMLSIVDNEAFEKKMRIIRIVRSKGLGKTNLAKKVFDKLSPQFDCATFVLVGQNPNMRKVFTDILIGLDKQKYKDFPMTIMDIIELIGLVRKSLMNKRFFVVVDDIWDLKAWDIIMCALIDNSNGSAVLTTANPQNWDRLNWRASEDNSRSNAGKQSDLRSTTDPKEFFCKKLFGSEDDCPDDLKDICVKLIELCGGILSVVDETVELLAGVPRTLKDWQAVYERRKLALSSYPGLPDCVQKCLQYFCMFQRGYEITAERLVWAWIAQGFVQETEGEKDLQKVGQGYVSDLIKGKMIEAVEVDADGMALSCRVYDSVYDFIVSKSTEENFIAILNDSKSNDRAVPATVHGLSIQGNDSQPKPWFSKVKSLVAACDNLPPVSGFGDLLVMDLGGCVSLQVAHLKGISKAASLGYLAIGGKCIAAIPREIAKLKHLRTLDLSASGLSELPQSVLLLSDLERLFINSHMKIPDGIAKMSALQELGDVNIVKPKLLKKLCKLSKLRVLRIAKWSWDEGKSSVKVWWDTLRSVVGFCENIESLSILTFCSLDFMDGSGDDKWPPQTLKKLEIRHSTFFHDKLPSWFHSLANISSLTIEVNKLSKNVTNTLGMLSALCSLSLTSKEVPEVYFVIDSDTFKKLESLKFVCNAMVEMFAPQSNATQQLTRLTIVFQASRTKDINKGFRFGLDNLRSLEHVRVEINCFNASHQMVKDAEDAIRKELSRAGSGSSPPNLEIRRLDEESMIAEEDKTTGHQVARTSSLKTEGNGDESDSMCSQKKESDSMDLLESTPKTMQAEPVVVGPAPMSSAEIVSKVLDRNSSNNTFLKNVAILASSMKIEKSTKRALWQEHAAEKQGSTTTVHLEVDVLRKKSEVTEKALANTQRELANTQRELEEFKKQMEQNNLLLKRILQLNNATIS